MSLDDISINELRSVEEEELRQKIDVAYANPLTIHLLPGTDAALEYLSDDLEIALQLQRFEKEGIIRSAPFQERPSLVYTRNSHMYKAVLELAFEKLAKNHDFRHELPSEYQGADEAVIAYINNHLQQLFEPQHRENAKSPARNSLQHEQKHAVAGLGYPKAEYLYALEFTKNTETGQIGIRPMLILQGELPIEVYKTSLVAPGEDMSLHDRLQSATLPEVTNE